MTKTELRLVVEISRGVMFLLSKYTRKDGRELAESYRKSMLQSMIDLQNEKKDDVF